MFGWLRRLFNNEINVHVYISGEVKLNGQGIQVVVVRSEEQQGGEKIMSVGGCGSQGGEGGGIRSSIEIVSDENRLQGISERISGKKLPEVKFGREI